MSIYSDVVALEDIFLSYCVDDETGEVDEEQEKQLAELKEQILSADMEKLCKVRANLMARADAIKQEKLRIAEAQKRAEKDVERINKFILFGLHNSGLNKVQAGTFTVSSRLSTQLNVDEDKFCDDNFITIETIKKIDKNAIKNALKNGVDVKDVTLIEVENLQVK